MKRSSGNDSTFQKKKAKVIADLPTQEEQKQLQQMEILLKNNLLQLQCEELLRETTIATQDFLDEEKVAEWLQVLKNDLLETSERSSCNGRIITFDWISKQHYYGLEILENSSQEISIEYQSPSHVDVVGSATSKAMTPPYYNIDLLLTLPESMIEPSYKPSLSSRDVLDFRYFNKRKLFLAGVWKSLQMCDKKLHHQQQYRNISVHLLKYDTRKPVLNIIPGFSDRFTVRIIPVLPESCIKTLQLRNRKNNVRPQQWKTELRTKQEKDLDLSLLSPTPHYNMAILEDIALPLHQEIVSRIASSFPNVIHAIILFKIWATKREIRFAADGVDGHQATVLTAYLLQSKRILPQTSPEVIFQGILNFFVSTDFSTTVLEFSNISDGEREEFKEIFPVCLLHPTKLSGNQGSSLVYYNVLWRVSQSMIQHIRFEAEKSLALSHGPNLRSAASLSSFSRSNIFEHYFLESRSFFSEYDLFFHFAVDREWSTILSSSKDRASEIYYKSMEDASLHFPVHSYFSQEIRGILERALGNRVSAINCYVQSPNKVNSSFGEIWADKIIISAGLQLDKEHYSRKVERGPSIVQDSPLVLNGGEAKGKVNIFHLMSFKDFWGSKCEVRRFRDGSIQESVVWENSDSGENHYWVIKDIITFILKYHLGFDASRIFSLASSYRLSNHVSLVTNLIETKSEKLDSRNSTSHLYLQMMTSFDELKSILTSQIQSLPLSIDTVLPVAPALRQTSFWTPSVHPLLLSQCTEDNLKEKHFVQQTVPSLLKQFNGLMLPRYFQPIAALLKFESSGKWPKSTEAILQCKSAFLLKIKYELRKQFQIESIVQDTLLDIMWKGFLFRFIPFAGVENERIVLSGDISSKSLNQNSSNVVDFLLPLTNRQWVIPSLHHNAIKTIQMEFPIFSETVKMMQFWLANHNLSGHICHEVMELMVAKEFLLPRGFRAPTTPLIAFHHCLQSIIEFNWDDEPWMIDLNPSDCVLTADIRNNVYLRFKANREYFKSETQNGSTLDDYRLNHLSPIMYIVTSNDKVNQFFPSYLERHQVPERVVFNLFIFFAKATCKMLSHCLPSFGLNNDPNREEANRLFLKSTFENEEIYKRCHLVFRFSDAFVPTNSAKACAYHFSLPSVHQLHLYKNTPIQDLTVEQLLIGNDNLITVSQQQIVDRLQSLLCSKAILFWNEFHGERVGILFRPSFLEKKGFNILSTELQSIKGDTKGKSIGSMTPNINEIVLQVIDASNGILIFDRCNI